MIGIVTWTRYNNYGTVLQAYGLYRFLKKNGFDVQVISDSNDGTSPSTNSSKPRMVDFIRHPRLVLNAIQDAKRNHSSYFPSQGKISHFKETMQISDNADGFDTYICGSDQIWSPLNYNPYYFLQSVTGKKIAYAPSLGINEISEKFSKTLSDHLRSFHAVSVRERNMVNPVSEAYGNVVKHVCDPTILAGREVWDEVKDRSSVKASDCIVCYFLENREWYFEYAKTVADIMGKKLYVIPSCYSFSDRKEITDFPVGIEEFVYFIANADYVITDSYHASIFSILYERQFACLARFKQDDPRSQNSRVLSLLSMLDIGERFVTNFDDINLPQIEYSRVSDKICKFRIESEKWLLDSLG